MIVGFDLWGTLVKGSPNFHEAKRTLIKQYFTISPNVFLEAMDNTKKVINPYMAMSGQQPTRYEILNVLQHNLGFEYSNENIRKSLFEFYEDYNKLYTIFPFEPFSNDTLEYYNKIRSKHKIAIVSNTMFIRHESLQPYVEQLFGPSIFIGSSSREYCKPDRNVFNSKLSYFIGDTPETDGEYAESVGAQFIQINTNDQTIEHAYDIINSNR